jgi:hypothetical protein
MTGPQFSAESFRVATTDLQRIDVIGDHPSFYASYEPELLEFVTNNWAKWQADKPDWFTDDIVASIPDKFIPVEALEELNREGIGGQRRRSSFGGMSFTGGVQTVRRTSSALVVPINERASGE